MRTYSGRNKQASRRLAIRAAKDAIERGDETTFAAVMGKRLARNSDPLHHVPSKVTAFVRNDSSWSRLAAL